MVDSPKNNQIDLSVKLCGIDLSNPIIPASGTFGFGKEFAKLYDINVLGSFCTKGSTRESRIGNAQPRIAECKNGLLNSVGLQNNGMDSIATNEFEQIKTYYKKPVIANIGGFSQDEYVYNCCVADNSDVVGWIELNVSCPNVTHGGMSFGTDPKILGNLVKKVKSAIKKPLIVKLTPNVTDVTTMAMVCEQSGADGVSLINTLLGARIDIAKRKFILANKYGGYSGQAVFPIALRMVNQVYNSVKIPIVGMGGISSAEEVVEMMMAGATAVQIGTANLINPYACKQIISDLPSVCNKLNVTKLSDVIGVAK